MNLRIQAQRATHLLSSTLAVVAQRLPFIKHFAPLISSPATLRLATPLTVSFAGIDTLTGQTTFVEPLAGFDNPTETIVGEDFTWAFKTGGNHTAASYSVTGLPPGATYSYGLPQPNGAVFPGGTITGVVSVQGTFQVTIIGWRNPNETGSKTPPYNLIINATQAASPFENWQQQFWTGDDLANEAISGPNADPDGDNIPNLLEFTLNLNPLTKETIPGTFGVDPDDNTGVLWEIPHFGAGNLTFQESSTLDGDSWTDVPEGSIEILPNSIQFRASTEDATKKFFRLKATL
ncbi:hypothetical protein N9A97_00705 [bacterium]|nr:hypothetical protein [bacterium]MDA8876218.1 hypothetical protein [Akkermansiaceae bacterium]MDB4455869.1 hypothetical protein [bacterium]MDB4458006.1 hypothetical protein [Akkermansiaceae bacterium]MDB4508815.1 hypothetical protein [Akkermansiaceae bacterium]